MLKAQQESGRVGLGCGEGEQQVLGKFFFATDPDGYKIEVLAKMGRFADL